MKKTISLLLALLAVLSLAACQNADPEGTSITTTEATTEAATVPAPQLQAGYYLLTSYETDGLTIEGEMADEMKMYIRIEEDGTGLFSITGMSVELTWDDSFLSVEDAPCAYTLEDDLLILTVDDSTKFALQYHGDELPEYYVSPTVQPGYYVASSGETTATSLFTVPSTRKTAGCGWGKISPARCITTASNMKCSAMHPISTPGENVIPYDYTEYYDGELGRNDQLLTLYFLDQNISVAFRPVEDPLE